MSTAGTFISKISKNVRMRVRTLLLNSDPPTAQMLRGFDDQSGRWIVDMSQDNNNLTVDENELINSFLKINELIKIN